MSEKSTTGQSLTGAESIITGEAAVDSGMMGNGTESQKLSLDDENVGGLSRGLGFKIWLSGSSWIGGSPTTIGP
jgi:hypothetical protein